jgi:hypothetical protein
MKAAEAATVKFFFLHAVSMKKGRIVNYHGRGRKKTAKIAAQIRAVAAHLPSHGPYAPRHFVLSSRMDNLLQG